MKRSAKRLSAAILVLFLCFGLLPTAKADVNLYKLEIDGEWVDDENRSDILGNGVFSFDGDHTLTINGDYTEATEQVIKSDIAGLVICVAQDSTLATSYGTAFSLGGNSTITGPGALTLNQGIYSRINTTLTIEDVSLTVTDVDTPLSGADTETSALVLRNVNLTLTSTGKHYALAGFRKGVEMTGCAITAPEGAYFNNGTVFGGKGTVTELVITAIPYEEYDLTIDGVTVSSNNRSDVLGNGVFSFDGDHTLTVSGSYAASGTIIDSSISGLVIRTETDSELSTAQGRGMDLRADTELCGEGALTLSTPGDHGIVMSGHQLTLNGAQLEVTSAGGAVVGDAQASLLVRQTDLTATAAGETESAIGSFGSGITLDGCYIGQPVGGKVTAGAVTKDDGSTAPTAAILAIRSYPLTVGGETVTSLNRSDVLGNGVFSFDGDHTLTVNGSYSTTGLVVDSRLSGLVIDVAQDSALSSEDTYGLRFQKDATITGSGALTVSGTKGIAVDDSLLTLVDADVTATGIQGYNNTASLVVRDSNLTSTPGNWGYSVSGFLGGITLEGCVISEPEGGTVSGQSIVAGNGTGNQRVVILRSFDYPLVIDGVTVTNVNRENVLGNGVFSFDGDHTLSIRGSFVGSGAENVICSELPGLTLNVAADTGINCCGMDFFSLLADASITGPGTLTVTNAESGAYIRNGSTLAIENASVNLSAAYPLRGNGTGETLELRGVELSASATSSQPAVSGFSGGIAVEECDIVTPENALLDTGEIRTAEDETASTVTAASAAFPLIIDGVTVSGRNRLDVLGNGVFSFDGDRTLSISGDYTGGNAGDVIRSELPGLTLNVTADSVLDGNGRDGLFLLADTTITGPGALTVIGSSTGAYVKNGSTLTIANAGADFSAAYPLSGSNTGEVLELRGAELTATATGTQLAISDFSGGITLEECAIVTPESALIENGGVRTGEGGKAYTVEVTPADYPLIIDGVTVNSRNRLTMLGGVFSFDGDHTLTINGDYTGGNAGDVIRSELSGLTLNVMEDSVLDGNGRDGLFLLADTVITGPGALTVIGSGTGVYIKNGSTLTIGNANVSISAAYPLSGSDNGETLVLNGSELRATATGSQSAVSDFSGGITLEGCAIVTPENALLENGDVKTSEGGKATGVVVLPVQKPGAVESISTAAQPGKIVVTWTAAASADHYRIARQSTGTNWMLLDGNFNGLTYTDNSVEAGKRYRYTVCGENELGKGTGATSIAVEALPALTVPGAVENISAAAQPGKIVVTWTAAASADHYRIARQSTGTNWMLLDGNFNGLTYTDTSVEAGKRYRYTVCGENEAGKGTGATSVAVEALPALTIPGAVESISAEAQPGKIVVTWTAAASADHYRIARQSTGTNWMLLDGSFNGLTYTDNSVEAGKRYRYTVCAENELGKGTGATSIAVEALPALTIPGAVENISAAAQPGRIVVTWTAAENAEHYRIARQSTGTGWMLLDGNFNGLTYTDNSVEAGKRYRYTVCGENELGKGTGATSTAVEALPALTIPGAVESISAEAQPGRIVVTWTAAASADHYRIARQSTGTGWTLLDGNFNGLTYTDTSVEAGKRYRYTVCGENELGKGTGATSVAVEALPALTVPGAVESISAAAQPGKIVVTWTAAASADHYRIARQSTGTNWMLLDGSFNGLTYTDNSVEAGKRYRYTVCGENELGKGTGATSIAVEALPALTIPGAVESISAAAQPGRIVVTWTAAASADHYRIARQSTGTNWMLLDGNFNGLTYTDTSVEAGKRYRYTVCGENELGKGTGATSAVAVALAP